MDTVTNIRPAGRLSPTRVRSRISSGFRKGQIDRLIALIERHIAENRYPGCQIALARHGKLALYRSFGNAVTDPTPARGGRRHAVAALFQHQGGDRRRAVGAGRAAGCSSPTRSPITCRPSPRTPRATSRCCRPSRTRQVSPTPSSARMHGPTTSGCARSSRDFPLGTDAGLQGPLTTQALAHRTLGVLIEALTGKDFRDVIRETVAEPAGPRSRASMSASLEAEFGRAADMHGARAGR